LLLLTTAGVRSGYWHTNRLGYLRDGGRYVVFGTVAGSPHHDWCYNLFAPSQVQVDVDAKLGGHSGTG